MKSFNNRRRTNRSVKKTICGFKGQLRCVLIAEYDAFCEAVQPYGTSEICCWNLFHARSEIAEAKSSQVELIALTKDIASGIKSDEKRKNSWLQANPRPTILQKITEFYG